MKGRCHNCSKKGHFAKDCWAPGGGKEGQAPKGWKLRLKKDEANQMMETQEYMFALIKEVNDCAYISLSATDWLADLAATTHIARDRRIFKDYVAESTEIEGVVPGTTLRANGHGNVPPGVQSRIKNLYDITTKCKTCT